MLTHCYRSLSIKSNASQEQILFELEQLKYSFKEALRLSSRPSGGFSRGRAEHPDARVARNLHNLAAAAKQFHSAASSTSGTTRAGSSAPWQSLPPISLIGDFPEHKRQRVEAFVQAGRYPSPETVPTRRQPSLRTTSPSPSQHSALPTPTTAPSVNDVDVPASEPTQEVSEIDEDEEFEEEWEYFDGLRDLARDRIMKQDYAKAIEFINQAMTKVDTWDIKDELFVQLRVQLALCYFFKGDWRSAEPIVLGLASSALNEVTCNLLHALSLAHLFEYSLDSALRLCRKALKGKKSILENDQELKGGPMEADYGNTLALCSTIYHMKGDPIRAELSHRRLPQAFEYKHPASELEFIFSHPRLLPTVLGDDIPKFDTGRSESDCVGPESFFVFGWETAPQDAQKLYRSGTVLANSPLRQRFARHELYESDTDKIVTQGPTPCSPTDSGIDMSADEETTDSTVSTASINIDAANLSASGETPSSETMVDNTPYHEMPSNPLGAAERIALTRRPFMTAPESADASDTDDLGETLAGGAIVDDTASSDVIRESPSTRLPLRRRLTRMFTSRQPRFAAAGEQMNAPLTCPPEPSKASSGWFHNPSRAGVLRSKTLLRDASSNGTSGVHRTLRLGPVELTFKRTARGPQASPKKSEVDELPVVDDADEADSEKQLEDCYRPGASAAIPPSGQSKGRLAGLVTEYYGPDPSVGPYTCDEEQWPDPGRHALTVGNAAVPHEPDDIVAAVELGNSGSADRLHDRGLAAYSREIVVGRAESYGAYSAPTTSALVDSTDPSVGQALTTGVSGGEAQASVVPSHSRGGVKQRLRLDTSVKAEPLYCAARCKAQLPSRLASVLISLPTATDLEKQAMKSELETLLHHVRAYLNDLVLESDLRRILASLSSASRLREASNGDGSAPQIVINDETTRSTDSDSELFLWRCSSFTEQPPPSVGAQQQDPSSVARPRNENASSPRGIAPRHSFVERNDAALKFIMPPKKTDSHDDGNEGSRWPAASPVPEGLQTPRSLGLQQEERCRGEGSGSSALQQPVLQRAFSFVAGDDARYSWRANAEDVGETKGLGQTDEEGEGMAETLSRASPVQHKKQVSWAPADSMLPAVPDNKGTGVPRENEEEEEEEEGEEDRKDEKTTEKTPEAQQRSVRKSRFGVRDVSWWERAVQKDIPIKAGC